MTAIRSRLAHSLSFWSVLALLCVGLGQLGTRHWFLELFSHFTAHAIPLFMITAWVSRGRWRWWWCGVAVCLLGWALWPLPGQGLRQPSTQPDHRLVMANVNISNPDPQASIATLATEAADVMVVIEAGGARWSTALSMLDTSYPFHCGHQEASVFAMQLYAQRPMTCAAETALGYGYIRAVLSGDRPTVIYALHPPPPLSKQMAQHRNAYLSQLADKVQRERHPVIIVGDLNLSPFSPIYRAFLRRAGVDQQQPNFYPTWFPFYLSIDHILTADMALSSIHRLPRHGSDHHPLVVTW